MSESADLGTTGPTVRHEHGGVEWEIPVDLLELQRRFDRAEAECARLVGGDQEPYLAARQERLDVVLALYQHPWLLEQAAARRRHQADLAVKHLARAAGS
jgi:hypothetical protein